MFGSLKLGKLFGIDLYVHATFWLLPLFVFLSQSAGGDVSGAGFEVAVILAVFGCVALHEVGHALAARYYGIDTRSITLYPVGGVAALERMPERPLHEIVVALAGPAVNVVIAVGLLAGLLVREQLAPGSVSDGSGEMAFVGRLLAANVILVLFNLLPAFPMDGGRVLRAVLSLGLTRLDATRAAAAVGAVMAVGFGLLGWYLGNIGLMLVGVVVYLLGQAELKAVRGQEYRREVRRRRAEVFADDLFTGWRWDPYRRVWTQWVDGVPVREVWGD